MTLIDEFPLFVRVRDLRNAGFTETDAERIHRLAARKPTGFCRFGRFNYVPRSAVLEVIDEAKVETT